MAMKKFLLRICIFALIMVLCDIMMGFVGNYFVDNAKGGDTARKNYIANDTDEDVLIFGSSRAIHHYDPNIFEDSLVLTAYNCGFDGNGIICAYGFFHMIEERYHPKILIYEVTPSFDLLVSDDHRYLGQLRFFYDRDGIDSIFWNIDKVEKYKMMSQMYRYNSMLPQLITDNLHPLHSDNKGYRPLDDNKEVREPKEKENNEVYEYDGLKLYYIERLIEDCKGKTQLVFAISPWYKNTKENVLKPIQTLCDKHNIPLINHYTDTTFNNNKNFFNDSAHLNHYGATKYSKVLVIEIKRL